MGYDAETQIETLVTEIEPENGVYSGVQYKSYLPGIVSPQEEHTARLERGLTLADWHRLETGEKALLIANRRIRLAESNLQADAEIRAAKRKGLKGKR